jgi:hypothetical protein
VDFSISISLYTPNPKYRAPYAHERYIKPPHIIHRRETTHPPRTYLILFQVFFGAVADVYSQALPKTDAASLHASNMMPYAAGVAVSFLSHLNSRVSPAS